MSAYKILKSIRMQKYKNYLSEAFFPTLVWEKYICLGCYVTSIWFCVEMLDNFI